jgi:hypothetical protein
LTYSGAIYTWGKAHIISGKFDINGDSTKTISRAIYGRSNLVVTLHLAWTSTSKQVTGTVSSTNSTGAAWTANLTNDLSGLYSTGARYTMAIPPGAGAPTLSPGGHGYATITNFSSGSSLQGRSQIVGQTADGAVFTKVIAISKDGNAPLNIPMYTNSGILFGWLNFSSGKPTGNLDWIKTAPSLVPTNYQAGFTNPGLAVIGSLYTPPATGVRAIDLPAGSISVTDCNIGTDASLTWSNLLTTGNLITKVSATGYATNLMSGTVVSAIGRMTLSFRPTGAGAILKAGNGVVLQNSTNGYGAFTGTNGYTGGFKLDHP